MLKEQEQQLLGRFSQGDDESFKQIYKRFQGQLFYFAVKVVKEEGLAADLVAEGFIKLWERRPTFNSMDGLKAWLFTVIHNAGLNALAKHTRHDASHREIASLTGTAESVEHIIIRSEALQAIYEQIAALPVQCRNIMEATFIAGKSTKEIAKEMGLSEQTVINQKNRGIKLVRSSLLKKGILSVSALFFALQILDSKFF